MTIPNYGTTVTDHGIENIQGKVNQLMRVNYITK